MSRSKRVVLGGIIAAVSIVLFAGISFAGSLEPSGVPAPTMKTLEQIPPTWSIKLSASQRFVVLADFNNAAVLDRETGLVWEKSPSTGSNSWFGAINDCAWLQIANRRGWHLPTVDQLTSLIEYSSSSSIQLPAGHPFTNVQPASYWTASRPFSTQAYYVNLSNAVSDVFDIGDMDHKWCVRGGQSWTSY